MTPDLPAIAAELEAAQRDLDLYERLKSAAARVARLTKEHAAAQADNEREEETIRKAAQEARFAGFGAICVSDITKGEANLLHRVYRITYTVSAYDMYSKRNVPQERTLVGLRALPPEIVAYLIEKHPERIPAEIMALAPNNPGEALQEYFAALQRGYTRGKAGA